MRIIMYIGQDFFTELRDISNDIVFIDGTVNEDGEWLQWFEEEIEIAWDRLAEINQILQMPTSQAELRAHISRRDFSLRRLII